MMKVSIIIPVYNVKNYIVECLDSVSNQSLTDGVECILVDDCGQDNSIEIIKNYISCYKGNIKYTILQQPYNQGPSAARNVAIKQSNAEYLFFLDSDDKIMPNCIENLYNLAKKYESEYVQGLYTHDDGSNYFTTRELPEYTEDRSFIKRTLLNACAIHFTPHNKLVKRQFLVDNALFFREGIIHEDSHWLYFMSKYLTKLVICHEVTYYLRSNPNSLVHTPNFELEVKSYKTLIDDCCRNIDDFQKGWQKEFILNDLMIVIDKKYYHDEKEKREILKSFTDNITGTEKLLLVSLLALNNRWLRQKMLHLLIRVFKI